MALQPGDFVTVPLGTRRVEGVVWGPGEGGVEEKKLKDIITVLDAPPLSEELRALIDWTAVYTLSRLGSVLRMAMSVPGALEPPKPETAYVRIADSGPESESPEARIRMTDARRRVLAVLDDGVPRRAAGDVRYSLNASSRRKPLKSVTSWQVPQNVDELMGANRRAWVWILRPGWSGLVTTRYLSLRRTRFSSRFPRGP